MFSKRLTELTLASDIANGFFKTIIGDYYRDDRSFLATMRALLLNRIKDKAINLRFRRFDYSVDALKNASADAVAGAVVYDAADSLNLTELTTAGAIDVVAEKLSQKEACKGCRNLGREVSDLKEFAAPFAKILVYINEERRCTNVFVERLDMRKYHALQMLIPRYLPWFFNDAPVDDEELELLNTLTDRYAPKYEAAIEKFASKIDLRSYAIKSVLGGFEVKAKQQQLRIAKEENAAIGNSIAENLEAYMRLIDRKDNMVARIAGLEAMIARGVDDSELISYFTANKCLHPVETRGTKLSFIVSTYLDSYDPDMYSSISRRPESHFYNGYSVGKDCFRPMEARKKLMDAIFSDEPIFRVKTCSYYTIDTRGTVEVNGGYPFGVRFADRIENPHLKYHDCLGSHRTHICRCLNEGDIMGAAEQCISSAKSVNVGEGATIRYFLPELFDSNKPVLEMTDGTCMNPEEALKYLEAQEEKKEEAHDA